MANKLFQMVKPAKVKKSTFDLSHERKLSVAMGRLYPIFMQEAVPGDNWRIDTQSLIRLSPLVSPVMHRINSYVHFFFVPNRLLWSQWEDFITNTQQLAVPTLDLHDYQIRISSLADHLGLPICDQPTYGADINMLPFRAYAKIWNDYYRDQNLQTELALDDDDALIQLDPLYRAWEKDYFTSALPWAQKGTAASVPVDLSLESATARQFDLGTPAEGSITINVEAGTGYIADSTNEKLLIDTIDEASIDINELRQAQRLQRWLERNARAGTRYVEHLLAHWGVYSDDARLQRAEYIGGGKAPIVISEVLNTNGRILADGETGDPDAIPLGAMGGHGISVGRSNQAKKFCKEHGYIVGIMSIMPEPNYYQGIPRQMLRRTNLDFYYPEFAQLGEQEVENMELYFDGSRTDNHSTFGYQSRYAEYKYIPSTVHGEFRTSLEHWHLARKFGSRPQLNESFIQCVPDTRIFAVEDDKEHAYVSLYNRVIATRPMPFFNDPKL